MIPQIAAAGLFDILNERYIDDIKDLPYSSGNPSIDWQESKNLQAWIDITGFKNLSREGGINYTFADPSQEAIIQHGTKSILDCNYGSCSVDSIETSISTTQSGSTIIAHLHTVMKWTMIYCTNDGCQDNHYTEYADFYDSEMAPEKFNQTISSKINIVEYNNTLEPKISIQITNTNSSRISLNYGNKSLSHASKSYHVEQTEKGIYYANASDLESWDIKGQDIARFRNSIIINTNLSTFDYSQLDIMISNLYGSVRVDPSNFNITRVTYQPETILDNPVLYGFMGVFFTLICSAFYLIKQVIP